MNSNVEERPYQSRIVNKVLKAIKDGHKTVLVEAPTGAGKTIMAYRIAEELNRLYKWNYGWTCMRRVLLEQAQHENTDKFGLTCGTYFSTFTEEIPTGIDLLIEDEAQHSASDTSTTLYSKLNPKVHVAFTATPYRTDRMKLCFSKVIKDAGVRQLIDEGWLSGFHQYMMDAQWTPQNVANIYLQDPDRWGKSVAFFLTKEKCYEFQDLLALGGIECEVVEGGSITKQEKQIERFHNNEVQVLANVFVLTEGFDAPELKTVFARPGSKGPTVQMCGRALRKHKDKPYAQIVQNSKTKYPFSGIASALDKWVYEQNKWVSREGQHLKVFNVQRNALHAIVASPPPVLPKFLKKVKKTSFKQTLAAENQRERDGAVDEVIFAPDPGNAV